MAVHWGGRGPGHMGRRPIKALGLPPLSGATLIDNTTGVANFSAAPWALNAVTVASAAIAGPGGTGDATTLTRSAADNNLVYRARTGQTIIRARFKAGTAPFMLLYIDTAGGTKATWFNLAAGTIAADTLTGAIASLGGGWFEVETSGLANVGGNIGLGLAETAGSLTGVAVGRTGIAFDVSLYSVP